MMESNSRPHLLLFGWYQPGTGFTRVLEALLPSLALDYTITWLGVGYGGSPFEWAPGVRIEPTNRHGGDFVGAYDARARWSELRPDAVLALNDLWYLVHYSRALSEILDGVPMVGYLPLDGRITDPSLVSELVGFDHLVTYTESAAANLATALQQANIDTPVARAGHGVDLRRFRPLVGSDQIGEPLHRMQRAQAWFRLPEPAYVVLNASRPDPRKRIDLTLVGFAEFVRDRPGPIYLCLHQAFAHPRFVDPLREQAASLGIAASVLWHPEAPGRISDERLNALYNVCAVGINTALGEGFGLVSFEHAATGAPQIVPGQDALTELWGDSAWCLPTREVRSEHSPLLMAEVDPSDLAHALGVLHDDTVAYKRLASAALERSRRADLSWNGVADQLRDILRAHVRTGSPSRR